MREARLTIPSAALEGVLEEIQVIPSGQHETPRGSFLLDGEAVSAVMSEFEARKSDMVVDYEHQTLAGSEAPAAGWIKSLVDRGADGLWATVQWTERARAYLTNREYRYLSPVFVVRAADRRVMRLVNAALTNQPAIDGMVALVNKGPVPGAGSPGDIEKEEEAGMERFYEVLGLSKDAGASEVEGALMAMKQTAEGAADLALKVESLEAELAGLRAGELVALAMKEGKLTPAQRDWALEFASKDADAFKVFVSKAPVVVRLGGGGGLGAGLGAFGAPVGDGLQSAVNRALGVSDEVFRKHQKNQKHQKEA